MKKKSTIMENSILASSSAISRVLFLLAFLLFSKFAFAQDVLFTSGSGSKVPVPSCVTAIKVELWGGGGGGGVRTIKASSGAPGGGGGAYTTVTIPVNAGDDYGYSVGDGGSKEGDLSTGDLKKWKDIKNGKQTTFTINGQTVTANGGIGALNETSINEIYENKMGPNGITVDFGAGGKASANPFSQSVEFFSYPGGKGGNAAGGKLSGGGGGAGHPKGGGMPGTLEAKDNGGFSSIDNLSGGRGGHGVSAATKDGNKGEAYGGGGSGGYSKDNIDVVGGKGANGAVRITYIYGPTFKNSTGLWNNGFNWTSGLVPTNNSCVNIPATTIVFIDIPDAAAKTVIVNGKLTIRKDQALTVTDAFINNGSLENVLIESDGNLIQINENASINTGSITAKRDLKLSAGRQQYNYLISPLEGQSLATIYKNGLNTVTVPSVLYYTETNNKFYNSSGAYIKGRGLAVKEPTSASFSTDKMEATFAGKPTNGTFKYSIVKSGLAGDGSRGYNLIGNPYPSNIDLIEFYRINGGANGTLSPTFRFWDNKANNKTEQEGDRYGGQAYATFNAVTPTGLGTGLPATGPAEGDLGHAGTKTPSRYVKTGQGFMVRTAQNMDLTFTNKMRTIEQPSSFFGKSANSVGSSIDRYWLQLISPAGITSTIAMVYFADGNNAFTADDSSSMGGSDAVYSMVDGERVSINGKASFSNNDVIQLGTTHFSQDSYSIAIDKSEGVFANGQNIYLKDKQTSVVTNLSESNYVFQSNAGETTDRFEIIYKPETVLVTDHKVKEGIVVYRDGNDFFIQSPKIIQQVQVYDSSGKLITALKRNSRRSILDVSSIASGMYVLKITTADGEVVSRKIIR